MPVKSPETHSSLSAKQTTEAWPHHSFTYSAPCSPHPLAFSVMWSSCTVIANVWLPQNICEFFFFLLVFSPSLHVQFEYAYVCVCVWMLIRVDFSLSETTAARHGPQFTGKLPDWEEDWSWAVQWGVPGEIPARQHISGPEESSSKAQEMSHFR